VIEQSRHETPPLYTHYFIPFSLLFRPSFTITPPKASPDISLCQPTRQGTQSAHMLSEEFKPKIRLCVIVHLHAPALVLVPTNCHCPSQLSSKPKRRQLTVRCWASACSRLASFTGRTALCPSPSVPRNVLKPSFNHALLQCQRICLRSRTA